MTQLGVGSHGGFIHVTAIDKNPRFLSDSHGTDHMNDYIHVWIP